MRVLATLAALLALAAASASAMPAERLAIWEWSDVPRVVAFGDLHGGYDKLLQLLAGADLVDEALGWSGGETHLVVAGDFLDRGIGDRPLMDLLRRLQDESQAAGGQVHVLLGNHEVMNLLRDTRDVNPASYRDFVAEERKQDRQAAWRSVLTDAVGTTISARLRSDFNRRFPRGFFGRQRAFDRDGEYGRWLLRLPVIVKVNGVVYVHGGLTEEFASLDVDGLNRRVLDELDRHLAQRELLEAEGVITPAMDFAELLAAARKALERRRGGLSPELRDAARALVDSAASPVLGARGPLWYRGNSLEDERIERDRLERCLELVGATAMVVAHSYTGGNRITSRFHGQLYRLDHGIVQSPRPLALVAERGEVLVLDAATNHVSEPVREPPNGSRHRPPADEISDREMEEFLSRAKVTESRPLGRGSTRPRLVVLEKNGQRHRAIFKTVESGEPGDGTDRYQHEVAAYRLDRRLGLEMVPVTVIRSIDGRRGSLQWWVEGAVDQEAAEAYGLELCETEETARQLALGEVFESLIGSHDRKPSDVLCLVKGERVFMIDHSQAFTTSSALARNQGATAIPPSLAEALRSLDRESLTADLGELLDEQQIRALLERRDQILGRDAETAP